MKTKAKRLTSVTPTISLTLELTEKEAQALAALCCHVGGDPNTTYRYLTDKINLTLEQELDVVTYDRKDNCVVPIKGYVSFLDWTKE